MKVRDQRRLKKTNEELLKQAKEQVNKMEGSGVFSTKYYNLLVGECYNVMVEEVREGVQ